MSYKTALFGDISPISWLRTLPLCLRPSTRGRDDIWSFVTSPVHRRVESVVDAACECGPAAALVREEEEEEEAVPS